jgi:hypothetical protein
VKRKEIGEQNETLVCLVQSLFERRWRYSDMTWLVNPSHAPTLASLSACCEVQ